MRETSDVWKQLIAAKHTHVEYKFIIDGTEYTKQAEVEHEVHKTVFESFGIGNATIAQLNLTIYAGNVPRAAKIERMMRLVSGDEQISTDWEPAGVFFASRRAMDDDKWTVEAYDAMRKASVVWEPDQSLEFPMTMTDAVAEFCRILEVELDSRTVLNPDYVIDYPTDNYTIRNVLCFIGAANCGNWIITPEGKLYLVPLIPTGESHTVGLDLIRFEDNDVKQAVTRVTLYVDSAQIITAGYDHGVEIVADCPYATQTMVDAMLEKLRGFVYHPYEAGAARLDPAAELGDPVEVGGITSIIVAMTDDGSGFPDISAPGGQELADDYPEAGPMSQQIDRKLATLRSTIEKTIDGITFRVEEKVGADGTVYAEISIGIGHNSLSGFIQMTGNLQVNGQLSADALYAAMGTIADLTVSRLRTENWIKRYLARDMSDADYINIEGDAIEFRGAQTDGRRVQAKNPNGMPLYWEADVDTATLSSDGWPYIDGKRVFFTTAVTDWPAYRYDYTESIKRSIHFEDVDGAPGVIDTFGVGDGAGGNIGWILKSVDGLRMIFRTSNKQDLGIVMNNDGHMDLYGLRRTSFMDFSEVPTGKLYEYIDGIDQEYSWTIERDSKNRPVRVIDDLDGHVCQARWWD